MKNFSKSIWKNCGSAASGTPLEIERGAYRELEDGYTANVYITKPNTLEWSDDEKYVVAYFEDQEGDVERRNEKEWKLNSDEECVELIKKEFGINLKISNY